MVQTMPVQRHHQQAAHCKDGDAADDQISSLVISLNRDRFGFELRQNSGKSGAQRSGICQQRVVFGDQIVVVSNKPGNV